MAQHKVGRKYLSDEEYEIHAFEIWSFWLFILGAFMAGAFILDALPEDWSQEFRYGAVLGFGGLAGFTLASLALYIRMMFSAGLLMIGVSGVLYWVWTLV